jgi:tRNA(Ile)-lysidine synthase
MLSPGDRVGVAVSGGADSVCLLRLLLELRPEIGLVLSVVHFDHQLRPESADDARFVEQLAREHRCDFHLGTGDVRGFASAERESLETAARTLRYRFFDALLASGKLTKIATAHTRNDQAETVALKLLRGAGPKGLSGIFPVLTREHGSIIRPLLFASRDEIEAHLQRIVQPWHNDATNAELIHTRNRIRHTLMPLLREFNPDADAALAQTAEILREEDEYLDQETKRALAFVVLPGEPVRGGGRAAGTHTRASLALSIEGLARYPLALQRRLVRTALQDLTPLTLTDTDRILMLAGVLPDGSNEPKTNKWIELPGGIRVRRLHRELQVQRSDVQHDEQAAPQEVSALFDGSPLTLSCGDYSLRLTLAPARTSAFSDALKLELPLALTLRPWRAGDRFHAPHTRAPKKVKEHLQLLKLAPEERVQWPVLELAATHEIVWVRRFLPRRVAIEDQVLTIEELSSSVS